MPFKLFRTRSHELKHPFRADEDVVHDQQQPSENSYGQQLHKKFGLVSMIGFSCTIMITWEAVLFIYNYGMTDGGPLGSIIGFIFCWAGYTGVSLCLAELNSMYPTGMQPITTHRC